MLARDCAHRLATHARHERLRQGERLGRRLLLGAEAVVRELQVERLARLHLLAHEGDAPVGDLDGLRRVRRDAALGALVRVRSVGEVETDDLGILPADVPLAEVRARVAEFAEPVARGLHARGERGLDGRRHHAQQAVLLAPALLAPAVSALVLVGHVQLRRRNAGDEARTRRRAPRRGHVEIAEAHAVRRELLEVRRESRGAGLRGRLAVHVDGGARPAGRLSLDEDEVRPGEGRGRSLRRGCGRRRGCDGLPRLLRRRDGGEHGGDECDACDHVSPLRSRRGRPRDGTRA